MNVELYELVQSMTKNEKGYFIKQLNDKESHYGRLFQMIATQKTYDESFIKSNFRNTYINENFSFAKNYLYHSILKALIKYGSNQKNIHFYFGSIQVLYEKGLYPNCVKLLKQLLKKTEKENDYLTTLQIIQQIKLLLQSDLFFDKVLMGLVSQEAEILRKQKILSTYQSLFAEIQGMRMRKGILNEPDHISKIKSILNHEYLQNESRLIDNNCKLLFHETIFLCAYLIQDVNLVNKHIKILQSQVSKFDVNHKVHIYRRVDILRLLIRYHQENLNEIALEETITDLKFVLDESNEINQREWIEAYAFLYAAKTNLLLQQNEIEQTEKLFLEVEYFLKRNDNKISVEQKMVLSSNKLILVFMNANYKNVLLLANHFLSTYKDKVRNDISIGVKLMEIVVCFELGNVVLFESRLIAFKRYLKKNKIEEISWKIYTQFLDILFLGKDIKKHAMETEEQLNNLKKNSIANNFHFLVNWVRSKE